VAEFVKVAESRQIKERFGFEVQINGEDVALFRWQGKIYALKNKCPHQSAPIHRGFVKDNYAVCPHHGWKFKVDDGAFINNEIIKLKTYNAKETDGEVYIQSAILLVITLLRFFFCQL